MVLQRKGLETEAAGVRESHTTIQCLREYKLFPSTNAALNKTFESAVSDCRADQVSVRVQWQQVYVLLVGMHTNIEQMAELWSSCRECLKIRISRYDGHIIIMALASQKCINVMTSGMFYDERPVSLKVAPLHRSEQIRAWTYLC